MTRRLLFFWYAYDVVLTLLGDYFLKRWSVEGHVRLGILAYGSYAVMLTSSFVLMKDTSELARLSAFLYILNIAAATVMGAAYFGEHLTSLNWVGLGLALVAVVLLS